MITNYTQKEIQHIIRVHAAMHEDYKKLYRRWELCKNPIQKAALEARLRVKANRLAALSEEIRQLTQNDSIIEEDTTENVVIEDYEAVALGLSMKNASLRLLLWIALVCFLTVIIRSAIASLVTHQ